MSKKCVVLGITGGIAAYKAAALCSRMTQNGYDVHVIMTDSAQEIITSRTFFTLSRRFDTRFVWFGFYASDGLVIAGWFWDA